MCSKVQTVFLHVNTSLNASLNSESILQTYLSYTFHDSPQKFSKKGKRKRREDKRSERKKQRSIGKSEARTFTLSKRVKADRQGRNATGARMKMERSCYWTLPTPVFPGREGSAREEKDRTIAKDVRRSADGIIHERGHTGERNFWQNTY